MEYRKNSCKVFKKRNARFSHVASANTNQKELWAIWRQRPCFPR